MTAAVSPRSAPSPGPAAAPPPPPVDWQELTDPVERERARLRSFGRALAELKARVEGELGEEDVVHIRRLQRFSRTCEGVGRVLIHVSPEPLSFGLGVLALFVHKQLQTGEIGHTCLHGAYDRFPEIPQFHRRGFTWDTPIDEESWHRGHNLRHHQHTNVAGKDPDIHFGPVRLTEHTPHRARHRAQHLFASLVLFPQFTWHMNWHFSGLNDVYLGNGRDPGPSGTDDLDFLPDRSPESVKAAHAAALRKYVPYFVKNYVFFPALAGPMFWKVLLGNFAAEVLRDVYTAASIYPGHLGEEVAAWPEGTKASGKGAWYAMQAASTQNYEVPWVLSVLCGGLDRQIEHHLFPTLTPRRLRQIAPEVRAICLAHEVPYRTGSWGGVLRGAFRRLRQLGRPEVATGPEERVTPSGAGATWTPLHLDGAA